VDAFMCFKHKCKVVSLNLAHPVESAVGCLIVRTFDSPKVRQSKIT